MAKKPKLTPEEAAKEAFEKASRKAAPRSLDAWLTEVAGVAAFANKKVKMREATSQAWLASMQAYYQARLTFLLQNIPAGFNKKVAGAIVDEVKAALA